MCLVICIEKLLDCGLVLALLLHSLILGDLLSLVYSAKNRHSVSAVFWLPEKSGKILLKTKFGAESQMQLHALSNCNSDVRVQSYTCLK